MSPATDQQLRDQFPVTLADVPKCQRIIADLRAAAQHIEQVGLIKGQNFLNRYEWQTSPCCAMGALCWVSWSDRPESAGGNPDPTDREIDRLYDASDLFAVVWGVAMSTYNDMTSTTGPMVADAMRQTADRFEGLMESAT